MEHLTNARLVPIGSMASSPYGEFRQGASPKPSARGIVQGMRTLRMTYQDAVCEFQKRYIIQVLVVHACHLGRTARELGMHRNTLARTIAELKIDIRQIREGFRAYPVDKSRQTSDRADFSPHFTVNL